VNEIETIIVPEETPDPYPYPLWSPDEESTLRRWYHTLGITQCIEHWYKLTGRDRSYKQIERKANSMLVSGNIPDDFLELLSE